MTETAPESKTEKVAVSLTPSEKLKLQIVAGVQGTTISELIRERVIGPLVEEHRAVVDQLYPMMTKQRKEATDAA